MQICSGTGHLQRGAERFCISLSEALVSHGHEVLLMAGKHQPAESPKTPIPIVMLPEVTNRWLRKAGFDYFNPLTMSALKTHLENFEPQIVHVHSFYGLSTALVSLSSAFCPVVVTLHDAFLAFTDSGISTPKLELANSYLRVPHGYAHRAINRMLMRNATLVSPSKWLAEFFHRAGFQKPRIIPNGVRPSNQQTSYDPVVLWVGGITKFKGLPSIIDHVAPLLRHFSWRFVVVGDGPYREKLSKDHPEVEFVGACDPTPFYKQASILLVSPIGWENFPTVILEAMRHGLCVIGRNIGGIPELVSHNHNGLLYQTEAGLTDCLTTMISSPSKLLKMGGNGHSIFQERYRLQTCVNHYLELYQSKVTLSATHRFPAGHFYPDR